MIAFTGFCLVVLLAMLAAPQTAFGRLCHRQLVELPIERLRTLQRHDLIHAALLGGLMLAGGQIVIMLGPEIAAAYAFDLAVYFDAILASYAAVIATRLRGAGTALRLILRRPRLARAVPRRRRKRAVRRAKLPANDDEDPAPGRLAA